MIPYYSALKKNVLFHNLNDENLTNLLICLNAYVKSFTKNQIIRFSETKVTDIGIVVKGLIHLIKSDVYGNRIIMSEAGAGKSFGESIAITEAKNSPISVISAIDSTVIFIPVKKILEACSPPCAFHIQLTENIIKLLAEKNMALQMKIDILSQKTTREKLLLYFEYESKSKGNKSFKIHFSREELADFLSLNPSAMSRELGKMRDEGLLVFHKNSFKLKI